MAKKKKASSAFWRAVISAIGIALILLAVSNISLFFFGESATAEMNSRRLGGADESHPAGQRYEWSVDYEFKAIDGQVYSGHTSRRGNDTVVYAESTVYYFSFAPFVNSLQNEVEPNPGQPLLIAIGVLLLYVMNRKDKKPSGNYEYHKQTEKESVLEDYDDSIEEKFHESTKVRR